MKNTTLMAGVCTWDDLGATMESLNIAWGEVRSGFALRDQPTIRLRGVLAELVRAVL